MRDRTFGLLLLILLGTLVASLDLKQVSAQDLSPSIFLQTPRSGEVLQGVETIRGKIRGEGLETAQLTFSYAGDDRDTWFFITSLEFEDDNTSSHEFIYEWDTTRITDGNYDLQITARFSEEIIIRERVDQLRIRNYSPIETQTPDPEHEAAGEETAAVPTATNPTVPTPTPLPENPVSLQTDEILGAVGKGLIVVGVFFGLGGIYSLVKRIRRKKSR